MTTIDRGTLYDLVWSEPVREVAARFGVSDTALKKQCSSSGIPVPERGYWAKLKAGKPVVRARLSLRAPGKAEFLSFGASRSSYGRQIDLSTPPPAVPVFPESLDELRDRLVKQVGALKPVRDLTAACPPIRRLLEADEKRRKKFLDAGYTWDAPLFDSPFEQRRLQLLNSIGHSLARHGGKLEISGAEGRHLRFKVGDQSFDGLCDHPKAKPGAWGQHAVRSGPVAPLRLEFKSHWIGEMPPAVWEDATDGKLEAQLSSIIIGALLTAEAGYRNGCMSMHQWELDRRETYAAEQAAVLEEAARRERERLALEAQQRRDLLLSQAQAWRQADDIRAFVGAVTNSPEASADSLEPWRSWALREADCIDPLMNGSLVISGGGERE